jgi:hypothetical protein
MMNTWWVGFTRRKKNIRIYKNGMLVRVKLFVFGKPNGILCLARHSLR